ncbi:berberine bridge enzyme-like 24 [Papaver somniferum]|uniref:berberine bridge enzyme-like 24 n=1 Tax=Papaver somniferum TaxID=3469 RepID=UPI000E6F74FF|nr:berberine bridge enzyme-like 24 [Papaver somniferum]
MEERFPELGSKTKDCIDMSWIQSVLFLSGYPLNVTLKVLLNQTQPKTFFKIKFDYVKEPISEIGLQGLWERLLIEELTFLTFIPYGGRMSEISKSASPFPHRRGNLFKIIYLVSWDEKQDHASKKYISGVRNLYKYMTPYVSKSPREAYINYRDLDLGQNSKNSKASYSQASTWGHKYFKNNYKRLVRVKSKVDPDNFFRHEQKYSKYCISRIELIL